MISIIETEIDADFAGYFEAETDNETILQGEPLSFLPGGIAYLRDGELGTLCGKYTPPTK